MIENLLRQHAEQLFRAGLYAAGFIGMCLLAHVFRDTIAQLKSDFDRGDDEARAEAPPRELPAWLSGIAAAIERAWAVLFPTGSRASDGTRNPWLFLTIALVVGAVELIVNYIALRIVFPGDLGVDKIAAAGLLLGLLGAASLVDRDDHRSLRWLYWSVLIGMVLLVTALGGYASYWIGVSASYPPAILRVATVIGALLRLLISTAAAFSGSAAVRDGSLPSALTILFGGTVLLITSLATWLQRLVGNSPTTARRMVRHLYRFALRCLLGFACLLTALGGELAGRLRPAKTPAVQEKRIWIFSPVPDQSLNGKLLVEGLVRNANSHEVCVYLRHRRAIHEIARMPTNDDGTFGGDVSMYRFEDLKGRMRLVVRCGDMYSAPVRVTKV